MIEFNYFRSQVDSENDQKLTDIANNLLERIAKTQNDIKETLAVIDAAPEENKNAISSLIDSEIANYPQIVAIKVSIQ